MTTTITTFLTYDTQAEEAAKLYTSLLDGKLTDTMRQGPEGPVFSVTVELLGRKYFALNGGPTFKFSEGFSLMVPVDTQEEGTSATFSDMRRPSCSRLRSWAPSASMRSSARGARDGCASSRSCAIRLAKTSPNSEEATL